MDPDDDKPVSSAIERLLNQVREGLDEGVFSSSISTNIPTVFQRDDSINEPIETTSRLIRASDRSFSLNNDYNIDDEIANLEVSTSYHVPKKTPIDDDARISSSIHQPRYTLERDDSIRIPVNIQTKVLRVSDRSFSTHSDDTPVVPTKKLGGIEEFSSNVTIPRSVQLRREDSIRKPTKVSFKLVKSSADSLVEDNAQESSRHDEKDVQETESEKNLDNDSIVTTSDKLFNIKESEPSQADPAPNVEEFIEQKVVEQEETSCHEGEGTGLKRTNTLVILEVIDTPEEAQGAIFDKDDAIVDLDDTEEGILKIKSRRTTNNTTESDDDMRKQLEQIIIENLPEVFETDEMTGPAGEENVDVSADFVNDDVSLSSESEDLLSMSKIQQWKDVDLISLRSLKSLVAEVGIMAETFPTETNDVELDVSLEAIHENTSVENVSGTSNDVTYFRIGDDSETVDETVIYIVKKETEEEILSAPEETSIEQQNRDDTSCTGPSVEKDDFNPVEASKEEHFETLRNDTTVQQEEVIDKQYIIPEENEHFAQEKNNEDIEEPVVRRLESETPSAEILDYAESLSQEVMRNVAAQFPPQETPILDDKERTPIFRPITPLENGVSIVESDDGDFQPIRKLSAAETLQKVLHTIPAPATEDFPYETGEVVEEDMIMDSVSESLKDEDEGLDSIGEISEIQRFHQSFDSDLTRRDSFSSISSFGTRQQFRTAIDNIRSGLLPFASSASQYIEPESTLLTMASQDIQDTPPADNSQHFFEGPESPKQDSSDGSMDSSGFEKVGDEEILSEYSNRFAKQMEQSLYGGLPEDVEKSIEDDFLLVTDSSTIPTTSSSTPKLAVRYSELKRKLMASQHHDDVQEKNYFDTAKILESPISEEARKLVQDAVESASDYAQTAPVLDDVQDEIAAELDKNTKAAGDLIGDVVEKVNDEKDHDDLLSDFVEKPQDTGAAVSSFLEEKAADAHGAVSDFVHETTDATKNLLEDSSNTASAAVDDLVDFGNDIARKIPEDIAEKTDNVHEEVDSFLSQAHRDSSPTEQQVPLTRSLGDFEEEPDFGRQTPESEETTFDRKGPLTIPEVPEEDDTKNLPDLTDFEAVKPYDHGSASHHGFETVPRPPTPPKDISDEDVKPSLVNLGPSPSHAHHDPHHSILKHKGEPWFDFKTVDPEVLDLIYWRDSKKSAAALSLILIAFFVLAKYPILSVLSYTGLAVLAATLGFRVFKLVEAQIKKTGGENPFQSLLAEEVTVPQEKVHAQVDVLVEHGTYLANQLKRLVLVESITDSVKFGLLLWSLTHISSWFSGFTIIFLAILGVFSIPKTYETYQEPIDAQLAVLQSHLQNVQNIVEEKLPFLRRPVAAEEKKDQ